MNPIFSRLRRRPVFALFLVFAVSGLMHEWVINVPLYHLTGRMLFGSMMAYFLLQAVGILVERCLLKGHPRLMVMFVWLVVFVPSPLVLNEGLLRVLNLWPEQDRIVVVDADADMHNTSQVLFRLCASTDPQRDSIFTKGPADVLDHATSEIAIGKKLGIDATRKLAGEGFKRPWPPLIKMDDATRKKVDALSGK